jgi:hypothetical protein
MNRCRSRDAHLPLLFALIFLTLFCGCLKRPGPPAGFQEADLPDPEAVYRKIVSRSEAIRTLKGAAHLRLETEEQKAGLDAVIACDGDGRLRFEILDWLNHVVFLAIFDTEGPEAAEQIRQMLGVPLKASELTALALGDPFFLPLSDPTVRISVDQNALLLDVEGAGLGPRYLVWLDEEGRPARMLVIRPYSEGRAMGDFHVEYGRYRSLDGVSFPHRIRVTATGSQGVVQVDYQKVVLNESLDKDLFHFVPPDDESNR